MPQTKSFLIHVDRVDPDAYDGTWTGELKGPQEDVRALGAEIERIHQGDAGFEPNYFPAPGFQATRTLFFQWIDWLAGELASGDTLFLHYSGHGGTIPNAVGGQPERLNTLCLADGMVLDAELATAWAKFQAGVVIVFSVDSCHSGSIARFRLAKRPPPAGATQHRIVRRVIPREVVDSTYGRFKDLYDGLQARNQSASPAKATVLQLAACTDEQSAYEDPDRQPSMGLFSAALVDGLRGTHPAKSYDELYARARTAVSARAVQIGQAQTPVLLQVGPAIAGLVNSQTPYGLA